MSAGPSQGQAAVGVHENNVFCTIVMLKTQDLILSSALGGSEIENKTEAFSMRGTATMSNRAFGCANVVLSSEVTFEGKT